MPGRFSRIPAAGLALVAAAIAGAAGFVAGSSWGTSRLPAPPPVVATVTAPSASAPPLASATSSGPTQPAASAKAPEPSSLELAAGGDLHALKALEMKNATERTPEEALAISAGHAALARADATRVADDLSADPKLFQDRGTMAYVYRLALDPDVAPTLLVALARLEDPVIADLLYDLVDRGEPGARLALLAEDLLRGPAVLPEASKALSLIIDLRNAKTCERAAVLLPRANAVGDERATPLLERYREKSGCGPKRTDDCFPCLRDKPIEKTLDDAIASTKARSFSAPWRLNR
ncbi:MAG: hypothetical protein HOV80_32795 [Polyangiaceae bacterium]|nr:hypothetical protein [Polyangiaceae bacterium]